VNKKVGAVAFAVVGLTVAGWWALTIERPRANLFGDSDSSGGPALATSDGEQRSPSSVSTKQKPKNWQDLKSCWENRDCPFSEEDPRAYDLAAGKQGILLLQNSREAYLKGNLSGTELQEQAIEAIAIPDGHLQEEALKAISSLPPSSQSLDAILENLALTPSPPLIEQAMKEFERYLGTSEEARIQQFLADFIARGGQFSSEKASEMILEFLNEKSEPLFQQALATMVPDSTPARHLRSALDQYHRQNAGG
jgi:hypothetical protein